MRNQQSQPRPVQWLLDYLRIRTDQPKPDYAAAVAFLQSLCREHLPGCECRIYEYVSGKPMLLVRVPGEDERSLLLLSHMDVVPAETAWTVDPFSGAISDDMRIVGRGSQDMKSIGIAYIEAMARLLASGHPLKRTVLLLFTVDEEIGSSDGLPRMVKAGDLDGFAIDVVLDEGAPCPLENTIYAFFGERAVQAINIRISGQSGHGSTMVRNTAADKLALILPRIQAFRMGEMARMRSIEDLGQVTSVNVNMFKGSSAFNVVPEVIELGIDIRIPPGFGPSRIKEIVEGWVSGVPGVSVSSLTVEDTMRDNVMYDPDASPHFGTLGSILEELGVECRVAVFPGCTDSRFLAARGLPCIRMTPFRQTPILLHGPDESLSIAIFLEGIDIYQRVLAAFCDL